jgi:nicotinamide-nucleotide amidase
VTPAVPDAGPSTDPDPDPASAAEPIPVTAATPAAGGLCALLGVRRSRLPDLIARLTERGDTLAAAESLTGGLFTAMFTEQPGSSAVLRGGIVCYATDLKHSLVGVDAQLLAERGPVDREVALQLAAGVRRRCGASIGVGLTGVAGPGPQDGVPAGTVFVAAASADRARWRCLAGRAESADRWQVRAAAVRAALDLLEQLVGVPGEQ